MSPTAAGISFRPLARSDFSLLQRWLCEPHVEAWWHEPLDLAGVEEKYGPRVDGREPTHVFVIAANGRPIGFIQWYRWSDYPQHAAQLGAGPEGVGIDLAIGEREKLGAGWGPLAIQEFLGQIVFVDRGHAPVIVDIEERNARSLRAFEKAGFSAGRTIRLKGETIPRRVMWREKNRQ